MTENVSIAHQEQPSEKKVYWGKILKGAAMIGGVILVAVVSYTVLLPLATGFIAYLNTLPVIGPIMGGIAYGANWLIGFAGELGTMALAQLGLLPGAAHTAMVGAGASSLTATQVAAAGQGAAMVGTGAAAAITAPLAVKGLSSLNTVDPTMTGTDHGSTAAISHTAANVTKISHAAAEHEHGPRADWSQRVNASVAYNRTLARGGDFSDAVRAAHDTVAARVNPRNTSFSQQLNADRAALESVLAEPKR